MRELSNEPKLFEIGPQSSKNEPDQKIQITFFLIKKKKLKGLGRSAADKLTAEVGTRSDFNQDRY